jgi:homoserine O-acetyltransferase/O-succinyltransferase
MQSTSHIWEVDEHRFQSGETQRGLRIAYVTMGNPDGEPVLVLHGTGGSGSALLSAQFGDLLFGERGPLDASRNFIVLPDALGHGKSSKPSDGLRTGFPRYSYSDLVELQHRLLTEALGITHCKLILGVSMGGMHAWEWSVRYPDFMDCLVPLAALPAPVAGRNWMLRRLLIDSVLEDPQWQGGHYAQQPESLRRALVWFYVASNGGTAGLQRLAPTRQAADLWIEEKLRQPIAIDANDLVYQWDSSRDYDPSADLHLIRAKVLAILSEDDERCPEAPLRNVIATIHNGRMWIIPEAAGTCGHATVGNAAHWIGALCELLDGSTPIQ